MNPWFAFILGLLLGWLIEWLIDLFYWRRRQTEREMVSTRQVTYQSRVNPSSDREPIPAPAPVPDDLKIINGIGPVIERKLNEAGIYTFEQLGNLTPADLERILGNTIERLADEEALLQQARDLAGRK